jgi:hypothetical protein
MQHCIIWEKHERFTQFFLNQNILNLCVLSTHWVLIEKFLFFVERSKILKKEIGKTTWKMFVNFFLRFCPVQQKIKTVFHYNSMSRLYTKFKNFQFEKFLVNLLYFTHMMQCCIFRYHRFCDFFAREPYEIELFPL